jgi:hypothetical protein
MYDRELLLEILNQTLAAVQKVIKRFESVDSVDYSKNTPVGMQPLAEAREKIISDIRP